jgi:chlorophyllide a reductase subunit Y
MKKFFGDVGQGYGAGVWEETPVDRPEFREATRKKNERKLNARAKESA